MYKCWYSCWHQGGQQHSTGGQTEAIPAGEWRIKSSDGQAHGNFKVKIKLSYPPPPPTPSSSLPETSRVLLSHHIPPIPLLEMQQRRVVNEVLISIQKNTIVAFSAFTTVAWTKGWVLSRQAFPSLSEKDHHKTKHETAPHIRGS